MSTGPMQAKFSDVGREIGRDIKAGDSIFLNDEVKNRPADESANTVERRERLFHFTQFKSYL